LKFCLLEDEIDERFCALIDEIISSLSCGTFQPLMSPRPDKHLIIMMMMMVIITIGVRAFFCQGGQ